jgi:hypothetical protein
MAYLGAYLTDDDDISLRPICKTFQDLVATNTPDGHNCRPSRRVGTLVTITGIGPNAHGEQNYGRSASIRSNDGTWTGWVDLLTLDPIIRSFRPERT